MPDYEANADAPPAKRCVAVIGAGSWGTALAVSLAGEGGHRVTLWARRGEAADAMRRTRRNDEYLPGARLPDALRITSDLREAVAGCDLWIVAVPSQSVRRVAEQLAPLVTREHTVVSVAKGIETDTLLTTSQVLIDTLPSADPSRIGVLYGPSHAEEVGGKLPTTVVVAMADDAEAERVQAAFMTDTLRVYRNADVIGVEIAGSVKNVMALAAGMCDGVGLGDNAKAAMVTRGLAEVKRLGLAMGADPLTFAGLAGIGDLVVTCFSKHSRNRHVGEEVGKGRPLQEVQDEMNMVAEGVKTTRSALALARKHGVEMPITEAVHAILFEGKAPEAAVNELMTRTPKREDQLVGEWRFRKADPASI
jgi:glycerol-3-phosphate dehydrogenase (NAD(P)+)